jgi:hypothetical protein
MRTFIFRYIGSTSRETIHAYNKGDAYDKLYKRGIPFYVIEFVREI